jgi:hypothetical protein
MRARVGSHTRRFARFALGVAPRSNPAISASIMYADDCRIEIVAWEGSLCLPVWRPQGAGWGGS